MEAVLEIKENNGFKNLNLKTKYQRKGGNLVFDKEQNPIVDIAGIPNNYHIIVEKKFAEGRKIDGKFGTIFNCGVIYRGEECSFLLSEREHLQYQQCGGVGDKVKITLKLETFVNKKTGAKGEAERLYFEQVA